MEFIYGIAGFLFGIGAFFLGVYVGQKAPFSIGAKPKEEEPETDLERALRERRELQAEQDAFRQLVGYNADVAYGLVNFSSERDKE